MKPSHTAYLLLMCKLTRPFNVILIQNEYKHTIQSEKVKNGKTIKNKEKKEEKLVGICVC